MNSPLRPVSLYLHLPFCRSRCGYCSFYSTTQLGRMDDYTQALCNAIAAAPLEGREVATLYCGGGTPSLLGERLAVLLAAVKHRLPLRPDAEITLEANPCSVDRGLLVMLCRAGFNRISFGWQSVDDRQLQTLGRRHTAAEGRAAVETARKAGFQNISVDFMLGTPGQTTADVERLCEAAAELDVPHISTYLLKIESGTAFAEQGVAAQCADADGQADLYLTACHKLTQLGYHHYEISNFAKPGYQSRHNTAYWRLGDYLGLGPAAYSCMERQRFHFPSDLEGFIATNDAWRITIDDGPGGDWEEYLMLALRLRPGLDLGDAARRYGVDTARLARRAAPLAAEGLVTLEGDVLSLTDRGFLVSNSVICYLLE